MFPILCGIWRRFTDISKGQLFIANFKQLLVGDARAPFGTIAKSFGKTTITLGLFNLEFNLVENGFDFTDVDMWKDTAINTAISVTSFYIAAGSVALICVFIPASIPGLIVIISAAALSMGVEWLIREISGYKD